MITYIEDTIVHQLHHNAEIPFPHETVEQT